jgi:hypothetical protein
LEAKRRGKGCIVRASTSRTDQPGAVCSGSGSTENSSRRAGGS